MHFHASRAQSLDRMQITKISDTRRPNTIAVVGFRAFQRFH